MRFHLKVAGRDFHQHLKQVHLRPFVLVKLLAELIDNCHPAVESSIPGATLKARFAQAVEAKYPETEAEKPPDERQGHVPPSILKILEEYQDAPEELPNVKKTLQKMVTFEKHATPGNASVELRDAWQDVRPKSFMLDKSPEACSDPALVRAGGFARYGEMHTQTDNTFLNQWQTQYTSQVLPFVIPKCVSGPDYPGQLRYRRKHDPEEYIAAMVNPQSSCVDSAGEWKGK